MSSLAEIIQQHGPAYQKKFAARLLPSHRRALWDLAHCRTAAFGGHLYECSSCQRPHYQYHSCQNEKEIHVTRSLRSRHIIFVERNAAVYGN
jgi:hypothetical protein